MHLTLLAKYLLSAVPTCGETLQDTESSPFWLRLPSQTANKDVAYQILQNDGLNVQGPTPKLHNKTKKKKSL